MHIKDMPAHERPQEKLLYSGVASLSTSELLALVIRTGSAKKSAVQLAEDVLAYAESEAGGLARAEVTELMAVEGIGTSKACSIVACVELARRLRQDTGTARPRITADRSDVIAGMLMNQLRGEKREHLIAVYLNSRLEVESQSIISIGELTSAPVHPREVFHLAVKRSAAAIILAHNHPSGDPTPSEDDIVTTRHLLRASAILGIRLVDHIILGDESYISLAELGYLKNA